MHEGWMNSYWKRSVLIFYPLGKKTQKNLMGVASTAPPPPPPLVLPRVNALNLFIKAPCFRIPLYTWHTTGLLRLTPLPCHLVEFGIRAEFLDTKLSEKSNFVTPEGVPTKARVPSKICNYKVLTIQWVGNEQEKSTTGHLIFILKSFNTYK